MAVECDVWKSTWRGDCAEWIYIRQSFNVDAAVLPGHRGVRVCWQLHQIHSLRLRLRFDNRHACTYY